MSEERKLQIIIKALDYFIMKHIGAPVDLTFEKMLLDTCKDEALKY